MSFLCNSVAVCFTENQLAESKQEEIDLLVEQVKQVYQLAMCLPYCNYAQECLDLAHPFIERCCRIYNQGQDSEALKIFCKLNYHKFRALKLTGSNEDVLAHLRGCVEQLTPIMDELTVADSVFFVSYFTLNLRYWEMAVALQRPIAELTEHLQWQCAALNTYLRYVIDHGQIDFGYITGFGVELPSHFDNCLAHYEIGRQYLAAIGSQGSDFEVQKREFYLLLCQICDCYHQMLPRVFVGNEKEFLSVGRVYALYEELRKAVLASIPPREGL